MESRLGRLALIGTAAGTFSALFGVGGGTIIVPLLILWFGYEEREATGTSLAAIAVIAVIAAGTHGLYGNVHVGHAFLIGAPAVAGVIAGTALQQRASTRAISGILAVALIASATMLVLR